MNEPRIPIFVVSPRTPRNAELVGVLDGFGSLSFVSDESPALLDDGRKSGTLLSEGEIYCKAGHRAAYSNFVTMSTAEWALVVEDDASVDARSLLEVLRQLGTVPVSTPMIVSLCMGDWGVLRLRKGSLFQLALYPPDKAVCYLINRVAAEAALREWDFLRPADWPIWGRQCRFWVVPGVAVESGAVSLIDPAGERALNTAMSSWTQIKLRLAVLSGGPYRREFGRGARALHEWWFWEVRQRLIWHMPTLYRGTRTSNVRERLSNGRDGRF